MSFTKITEGDLTNKGVRGLPDTPNLGTTDMQNKFEEVSVDVIIPKHNGLIDELEATTAAASIGALDVNGDASTVQDELVAIKQDAYTKDEADALFLTQTDAASTYLAQTDAASTYLAQTDAASTYLSQSDAASTYVAQVSGKDLSSNDYTDADKTKLAGIEAGANNYVLPIADSDTLGGVKPDGTSFTIDSQGVGHAIGSGGTSDYTALNNKPQINSVELYGNKSGSAFGFTGADIGYSNTSSGLTATDVQDAIDEVEGRVDTAETAISGKEAAHTILSDTLSIGATTLTFTNAAISSTSLIGIYTDTYGVNPTAVTQSSTSVTLTFDPQATAIGVKLEVRN